MIEKAVCNLQIGNGIKSVIRFLGSHSREVIFSSIWIMNQSLWENYSDHHEFTQALENNSISPGECLGGNALVVTVSGDASALSKFQ